MADKVKLTSWILKNREALQPSFVQFDWPNRYFKGLNDFKAALHVDGITATGRGIDIDPELALEKASAEAIERLICKKLNIDSVGCAVAGEVTAELHAQFEALERYYFEVHIEKGLPFRLIDAEGSPPHESAVMLCERFKELNPDSQVHFYQMAVPEPYFGAVCNISDDPSVPHILGLALHSDPSRALNRAFKEALMNYARMKDAPECFYDEVRADKDLWTCDPTFMKKIRHLFSNTPPAGASIALPELTTEKLNTSDIKPLSDCPITPVRCVAHGGNLA